LKETRKKHTKDLPRAQMMLIVIWACFVCDVACLQSQVLFAGVVVGMGVRAVGVDKAVVVE
jgi:hypothetical protein